MLVLVNCEEVFASKSLDIYVSDGGSGGVRGFGQKRGDFADCWDF